LLPESLLLFSVREGRVLPHWFTPGDHPWLRSLLDEYERYVGAPKRELKERLREPLPRPAPPAKLRIATRILDRDHGTDRSSPVPPRRARSILFTSAASSAAADTRESVVARAAAVLEVAPPALEKSLFSDLPGERRVARPGSPTDPSVLSLRANLVLAQAFLFRATTVRLELEGAARVVVRHAKLKGLIGTVVPRQRAGDALLELSGPFALFRRTLLYGRALAELVPLLAWCERFRLVADVVIRGRALTLELKTGDPIMPTGEPRRFDSKIEERFARDFARLAKDWELVREPEPVAVEGTMIFPDFALQHRRDPQRRWLLEIVGFWTRAYLDQKFRRLRAAAIDRLIVCLDEERNVGEDALPQGSRLVPYRRRIDAAAVLRVIESENSNP